MKSVADILCKKGPQFNTIEAGARVLDALSIMKTEETSFVIVTRNGHFAGIVTERDYAQKVLLMDRTSLNTNVEDIMCNNLPTVSSDDTVDTCMKLMNTYKTRYLPVFDDFEYRGVLSVNDLILANLDKDDLGEDWMHRSSERVF